MNDLMKIDGKTLKELEEMDSKTLRDKMAKSLAVLNFGLSDQAQFEFQRLNKIRRVISQVEDEILDPEFLKKLDPSARVGIYRLASGNMQSIMNFMLNLNSSVSKSMESLAAVDKLNSSKGPATIAEGSDSEDLAKIKKFILDKIVQKVKE